MCYKFAYLLTSAGSSFFDFLCFRFFSDEIFSTTSSTTASSSTTFSGEASRFFLCFFFFADSTASSGGAGSDERSFFVFFFPASEDFVFVFSSSVAFPSSEAFPSSGASATLVVSPASKDVSVDPSTAGSWEEGSASDAGASKENVASMAEDSVFFSVFTMVASSTTASSFFSPETVERNGE